MLRINPRLLGKSLMPQRLTTGQERFYRDQGYLIYDQPLFSSDKYNALKAHTTA